MDNSGIIVDVSQQDCDGLLSGGWYLCHMHYELLWPFFPYTYMYTMYMYTYTCTRTHVHVHCCKGHGFSMIHVSLAHKGVYFSLVLLLLLLYAWGWRWVLLLVGCLCVCVCVCVGWLRVGWSIPSLCWWVSGLCSSHSLPVDECLVNKLLKESISRAPPILSMLKYASCGFVAD